MKKRKIKPGVMTGDATCFCGKTDYDLAAPDSDGSFPLCIKCETGPTFRVGEEAVVKKDLKKKVTDYMRSVRVLSVADMPVEFLGAPAPGKCDICGVEEPVREFLGVVYCQKCVESPLPKHETGSCGFTMHYAFRNLRDEEYAESRKTFVEVCSFCQKFKRVDRYSRVIRITPEESVSFSAEIPPGIRTGGTLTVESLKQSGHVVVCPACDGRILCIRLGEGTSTLFCGSCGVGARVKGALLQPLTTLPKHEVFKLDSFRERNALHDAELVTKPVHTILKKEVAPGVYESTMVFLNCPSCRTSFAVNPKEPYEQGKTLCLNCSGRSVQVGPLTPLPIPRHPRAPVKKVLLIDGMEVADRRVRAGERRNAYLGVLEFLGTIDIDKLALKTPAVAWRTAVSTIRAEVEKMAARAERIETGTEKIINQCPRCEWKNSEPREYCRRCAWPDTPAGNAYAHGCKTSEEAELWDAEDETKKLPSIQIKRRHTFVHPQPVNGRIVGGCSCGWPTCGNASQAAWQVHSTVAYALSKASSETQGKAPGEAENPFGEKPVVVECERPHRIVVFEEHPLINKGDKHYWLPDTRPPLHKNPLIAQGACSCGYGRDPQGNETLSLEKWLEHRAGVPLSKFVFTSGFPEIDGHVWRPTEPDKVDSWGRCACGWPTGADPYTSDVCQPLHFAAHLANVLEEKAREVAKPLSAPVPEPQKVLEEKVFANVLIDGEKAGTMSFAEAPDFEKLFGDSKELKKQISGIMAKGLGITSYKEALEAGERAREEHLWVSDPDFPMSGVCSCGWPRSAGDGPRACKEAWAKHVADVKNAHNWKSAEGSNNEGRCSCGWPGPKATGDYKTFRTHKESEKKMAARSSLLGKPSDVHDLIEDDEFYRCSCGVTGFRNQQEWGEHVAEMMLTWSERNPGVLTGDPTFRDLVMQKLGAIEAFMSKLEVSEPLVTEIPGSPKPELPWNHCPLCHDTIDADDVHDGSELHCHACNIDLVVVEMATEPTTWTLVAREEDEDEEPKESSELTAAFKHLNTRMKESKGRGYFNVDRKHIKALLAELKRFEG